MSNPNFVSLIPIHYLFLALIVLAPSMGISGTRESIRPTASYSSTTDNQVPISTEEFLMGLGEGIGRVDEFIFIKKMAEKLNVKVYLFGGTASAFAHYVRWDLQRQKGDQRFHPARFDYRYINIYRSTQDLDIVVDGPSSAIQSLEKALQSNFPYLQGSKTQKNAWEVRSLRENISDKLALLNNPDFLNQHTDSNSVGLIEITTPELTNARVRDLKDWDNLTNSGFLNDILEGRIHYYFSPLHEKTKFYLEGRNPAILSVIRYFIKIMQFDLTPRQEDLIIAKNIIADFDPKSTTKHYYLPRWFSENTPKLIQNAIDVEKAFAFLEETGLRAKLQRIGDPNELNSVSWWMNKEPLKSFTLGRPPEDGKIVTASDLGITVIAHETTSFLVYEAITRSHQLTPNILNSRAGKPHESAGFGNGFYAMIGDRSGFRGTGFTIRFTVDPKAVLGSDFTMHEKFVVIKNRNAIKVLPEKLRMDLIEYYNWLMNVDNLSIDDRGIHQRLRLAMRTRFVRPTAEELQFLNALTLDDLLMIIDKETNLDSKVLLLEMMLNQQPNLESPQFFDLLKRLKLVAENSTDNSLTADNATPPPKNAHQITAIQRFAVLHPNFIELQRALELGLFINHEHLYWQLMMPKLRSIDEHIAALGHWQSVSTEKTRSRETELALRSLAQQFFSLSPNGSQTHKLLLHLSNPRIKLGLAALNVNDPEVYLASLMATLSSSQSDLALAPVFVRVWKSQRDSFFAARPRIDELLSLIKRVPFSEVQLDVLRYLSEGPSLRRSDLGQLISALAAPVDLSGNQLAVWNKLLLEASKRFLQLNPPPSELGTFLGSKAFSTKARIEFLREIKIASNQNERATINSQGDLLNLVSGIKDMEALNDFVLFRNNEISNFLFIKDTTAKLIKELGKSEASAKLLEIYVQQHPSDFEDNLLLFYSSPLRKLPKDGIRVVEPIWNNAFLSLMKETKKNASELIVLKLTVPSVASYRLYLMTVLNRAESLEVFTDIIAKNMHLVIAEYKPEEQESFFQVHNEIVPQILKRKMPLFSEDQSQITMDRFNELAKKLTDAKAILETLALFLEQGLTKPYFGQWGYPEKIAILSEDPRPKLTRSMYKELTSKIFIYTLLERHEFADLKKPFHPSIFISIMGNLLTKDMIRSLGLDKKMVTQLFRYFAFLGLQRILLDSTGGKQNWKIQNYTSGLLGITRQPNTSMAEDLSKLYAELTEIHELPLRVTPRKGFLSETILSQIKAAEQEARERTKQHIQQADAQLTKLFNERPEFREAIDFTEKLPSESRSESAVLDSKLEKARPEKLAIKPLTCQKALIQSSEPTKSEISE